MYLANDKRYDRMIYQYCGKSGLKLPVISLGLWHNFGSVDVYSNMVAIVTAAFDLGVTHFDLANNYGPAPGSAEENFGRIMKDVMKPYRDEMIISTKAGYHMWPGPYGDFGSRKYLISSLDQSLMRMGLDYVDIFYHHRPDPNTPLEETLGALDHIVRSGKALYVGISNYPADKTQEAIKILNELGTPLLIHQPCYSMFNRWIEDGLTDVLAENGVGTIAFSPLAQGLLTNRYLQGIPEDSRAASANSIFLNPDSVTSEKIKKVKKLNQIAGERNQTMAQLALSWAIKAGNLTSCLVGASRPSQIIDNCGIIDHLDFTEEELKTIDSILKS